MPCNLRAQVATIGCESKFVNYRAGLEPRRELQPFAVPVQTRYRSSLSCATRSNKPSKRTHGPMDRHQAPNDDAPTFRGSLTLHKTAAVHQVHERAVLQRFGNPCVSKGFCVSTDDQDTAAQVAALKTAGCERIFREKVSGGRWDRPELHRLLDQLRKGDVLVVWKLDRLSRPLRDVLTIMERLGEAKAGFRSLTEAIDTTTPAGRMMMQMVGAFAEFERAMLRERTKAGLDVARQEGRIGGRRPKLSAQQQSENRKDGYQGRQDCRRRRPVVQGPPRYGLAAHGSI